jgi:hypothetical protein
MKTAKLWGSALVALLLLWGPGTAGARDLLEVWPVQIEVSVLPPEAQQVSLTWGSLRSKVNINIDTAQTGGQTWRLWLIPRTYPANVPVEVIRWEGHPPMISGTAIPNQRVLAGQGVVDGRVVQATLLFWAQGRVPTAGVFPVKFDFILETLP